MNRRHFLAALAAGSTAIAVPELWTPSRTFFLPPKGGWANPLDAIRDGGWTSPKYMLASAQLKREMERVIAETYSTGYGYWKISEVYCSGDLVLTPKHIRASAIHSNWKQS